MPSVTNKGYDVLLAILEELANGLKKHKSNKKLTLGCQEEEELRSLKKELQFLRENYLEKEKETRTAYASFEKRFKTIQRLASNNIRIIKGVLDPKSNDLLDFGLHPEQAKISKRVLQENALQKYQKAEKFSGESHGS